MSVDDGDAFPLPPDEDDDDGDGEGAGAALCGLTWRSRALGPALSRG